MIRRLLATAAIAAAAVGFTVGGAAEAYAAPTVPPAPTIEHPVVDTTHTLTQADIDKIDAASAAGHAKTGQQTAVLITKTTDGDLEGYSLNVARTWGVGDEDHDNGVLILVALDDHKLRIEVGRGLEGDLPDAVANRIINDDMVPLLRSGDVAGAVLAGVKAVQVRGADTPPAVDSKGFADAVVTLLLVFVLPVGGMTLAIYILGRIISSTSTRREQEAAARYAAEHPTAPSSSGSSPSGVAAGVAAVDAANRARSDDEEIAREHRERERRNSSSSSYSSGISYGSSRSSSYDSGSSFGGGSFDGGGASGGW